MIELNKIYVENCLRTMQRMPGECVDMVMTSPPYDQLRDYKGFKFPFKHIARHLVRILKPGGVIVWVVADQTINGSETGTSFRQALFFMECGLRLHDTEIFAKKNYIQLTHNRYEQAFEYMFTFSKGKPKTFEPIKILSKMAGFEYNMKRKGYCTTIKEGAQRRREEKLKTNTFKIAPNIFYYSLGNEKVQHPAPFPEELARDQINTWSLPGEIIYDPFGGSGTTGKVCHALNRGWIISEISDDYSRDANKRIDTYKTKNLLF